MTALELLEEKPDLISHQLDDIDFVAEQQALELVEKRAKEIEAAKAEVLVGIFDKLNKQFAGRRISDTQYIGVEAYDSEVFATRTPDCKSLDEIFTRETIYNTFNNKVPQQRYQAEMLEGDGQKTVVVLDSDKNLHFWHGTDGNWTALDEEEANQAMLDLVMRAEIAVGTYEMRQEAARHEGLAPSTYTDLADADTYRKMSKLGYKQRKGSLTE